MTNTGIMIYFYIVQYKQESSANAEKNIAYKVWNDSIYMCIYFCNVN